MYITCTNFIMSLFLILEIYTNNIVILKFSPFILFLLFTQFTNVFDYFSFYYLGFFTPFTFIFYSCLVTLSLVSSYTSNCFLFNQETFLIILSFGNYSDLFYLVFFLFILCMTFPLDACSLKNLWKIFILVCTLLCKL